MKRKIVIGIAAVAIMAIAIIGMWLDFCSMQSLKWEIQDEKLYEGFFLANTAGADDLRVETPYVTLDPIKSVAFGEPLVVTGKSNREDGFVIVVTCKGPVESSAQSVKVENGTFEATFDTTDAVVGYYTVKADDGDGHVDEWVVQIGEAAIPIASPTPPQESIDEILKKLPMGEVLFNAPKEMKVGETELVEVRISQNITENLTKELKGRGEPEIRETKVSPYMKVRLAGINFDIDPQNGAEQIIERDKYTHWEFHVTPLKSGLQTLKLTYYVIIPFQGADRQKEYEVGDWEVSVNVTPMGLLKCYWQFIVGTLIAIIALIISIIGIRKKKRREER